MSAIDPQEKPFAWACQRMGGHVEGLKLLDGATPGGWVDVSVAWEIVKARLQACEKLVEALDQAFVLAAKAEIGDGEVADEAAAMILRTRTDLATMRQELQEGLRAAVATTSAANAD